MTTTSGDLVATDLHKSFGPQTVLNGLSLTIPAGSFTAVLGPSGSGKTTLLRILAGFERPDRGSVAIGNVMVDGEQCHVPPEQRRVGYVSQEGSLFPHLNVEANVGFGLPRRQRRGERVGELLEAVGLGGLARRYPHQLSGGQQQRVALARALAVEPRLVLLDEPFASLDAHLRASVRADVHDILRRAGTTAVLVTHDQDEALSIADMVAVIRNGTIAQFAPPQDIYAHPVDAELARFIGDANLIEGTLEDTMVRTAIGLLPAQRVERPQSSPRPATVLVRPEQIELHPVTKGGSPSAMTVTILESDYRGHDSVLSVRLERDGIGHPFTVRIMGDTPPAPGSTAELRVRGPVIVWPDSSH
jgi:iron(III) transport system ATP-binding protein